MILFISNSKIILVVCTLFISQTCSSFAANEWEGLKSELSLGAGIECIDYQENEANVGAVSVASINNIFMDFEVRKRWGNLFLGGKSVIPFSCGEGDEEWKNSGRLYQTNNLKYGLTRIDGYIGVPMTNWFNPFIGLRYTKCKQDRKDFIVLDLYRKGTVTEKIKAQYITAGIMSIINWKSDWFYLCSIEYFYPVSVSVTNSRLPGWEVSNKRGYALELKTGIEYHCGGSFSISIGITGGKIYWEGSDWESYSGDLFRWPENTTKYLNSTIRINRRF